MPFKSFIAAVLVVAGLAASAAAADTQERQRLVVEIIKAMRMGETAQHMQRQALDSLVARIREQNPAVSPEVMGIVREVLQDEFQGFTDELVPFTATIMLETFDLEDLKVLSAFYSSPTGQKAVSMMPAVMQRTMQFSQNWMRDSMPRIQKKLQERLGKEGLKL